MTEEQRILVWQNSLQYARKRAHYENKIKGLEAHIKEESLFAKTEDGTKVSKVEIVPCYEEPWYYDDAPIRVSICTAYEDDHAVISAFKLAQMPGCCGVCIYTGGTMARHWQADVEKLVRLMNYSALIWTNVVNKYGGGGDGNSIKAGMKRAFVFNNAHKSGNDVFLDYKVFEQRRAND